MKRKAGKMGRSNREGGYIEFFWIVASVNLQFSECLMCFFPLKLL